MNNALAHQHSHTYDSNAIAVADVFCIFPGNGADAPGVEQAQAAALGSKSARKHRTI